jgi:hypothetical protein
VDVLGRSRFDVTELFKIHRPNPGEDVEEIEAAVPGSCDSCAFGADMARVYLSRIRGVEGEGLALLQWKVPLDSPWLDGLGKFLPVELRGGGNKRSEVRSSEDHILYGSSEP